jgi:ABC-type dipeptide/oligopeptide/nickel transport system ATPase component
MPNIDIKSSDRVMICGRTGSGKSVLVNRLVLPKMTNYVVYDYKHEIEIAGAETFFSLNGFKKKPNCRAVIYRPAAATDEEFDGLCKQVFYRGNNTLVLDEIANHCDAGRIQPHHDLIMRLGRSKGVGIINCTQRPRGIHNNVMSQCEHFFIFDLLQDTDRKKLADFCGPMVMEYYHISMEEPAICRPVKI